MLQDHRQQCVVCYAVLFDVCALISMYVTVVGNGHTR